MFDSVLASVERFAAAYPGVFGVLIVAVAIPAFGSVASFADAWLAKRAPIATAVLRALLPDVKRALAIATVRTLEEKKLPVPPEVRELAIRRVEKAIEGESKRRPQVDR